MAPSQFFLLMIFFLPPFQGALFLVLDKLVLPLDIKIHIFRIASSQSFLQPAVIQGRNRMGAQVISKDKMAQNMRTSDLIYVQVVRADLIRSLVEKTPPTDPIFTHSVVAHILQQWVKFI